MKTLAIVIVALVALGGWGCKTASDCERWVELAADLAVVIADDTAKDEDRADAVERYATILKAARGAGCALADLPNEDTPAD